jgi:hypothetical protein
VGPLERHTSGIESVAFSRDGKGIVSSLLLVMAKGMNSLTTLDLKAGEF